MNTTQISAVFFITMTIIFSQNQGNGFIFCLWFLTLFIFSYSAWVQK